MEIYTEIQKYVECEIAGGKCGNSAKSGEIN